ncbi:hypothetical protein BDZ91DRAFT_709199 [Kalaharituber pfeilii]|nr:hypothetical protein BDZ91DRAFT_709199 [Kalaharituber pfeilii]
MFGHSGLCMCTSTPTIRYCVGPCICFKFYDFFCFAVLKRKVWNHFILFFDFSGRYLDAIF